MKKTLPIIIILVAAWIIQGLDRSVAPPVPAPVSTIPADVPRAAEGAVEALVDGSQVQGSGTVVRVLADDNEGSRHQRFILQIASGRTLLIAHNIDLAPRIDAIREGDTIEFFGEFESNPQGGVIHWTHRDPLGRHSDGWLRHEGRLYQ